MTMVFGHELFIAIRPTRSGGKERDLQVQPQDVDRRLYNREASARRWLHGYDPEKPEHPGFVLEVHLDQLFSRREGETIDADRRHQWHERMMQEHAVLAERWRDGGVSRLLDANDLQVLRRAAESWLASTARDERHDPVDAGLAQVLRALIGAGKLGGGR